MKTLFASLLVCASLCSHAAQGPADGFYQEASGPAATTVLGQDGTTWLLGPKANLKASVSRFASMRNDNSQFALGIDVPQQEGRLPFPYVLVVAGTAYRPGSAGCCNGGNATMSVVINGEARAREVAAYFNTSIHYLNHPGHRLQVSMVPAKPAFTRGEDINVTLRITNVGDAPVTIQVGGRDARGGKNEFFFTAYRNGKPVPEFSDRALCADCLSSHTVIAPGATFIDSVNLARWFSFAEAGSYDIQGSCKLVFPDIPAGYALYAWTEIVGAQFVVRMQ